MRTIFLFTLTLYLLPACTFQKSTNYSGDLRIGELVESELQKESPDNYNMTLAAETFVYGVVDQLTVDVAVTLYDTAENKVGTFDGPRKGDEVFYFEVHEEGDYRLEVAPFKEKTGKYTIELKVVEPIYTDPEKRIDQIFTPFSGDDVPGGVIGVMKDGELIYSKAYGMANLTHSIPYTASTLTNIGSVSKQFTAMAILLLEQQGKLFLEDDVRKYIPELPEFDKVITLKNLVNHTNGLREVYNLMPLTGWKGQDGLRKEEVLEMLKRQKELQSPPGEEYNYNNSAFIMLAEIVERISEQSFPQWMKENVFDPLGMESTVVRADPSTIVPHSSQGYVKDSTGIKEAGDLDASYGAGGIYTTVEDLNKWLNNFHEPDLGSADLIASLITPDTLNNGDTMTYAKGIIVGEFKGLKRISHGGADIAHRAYLIYLPEINAGVAALSNSADFPSSGIAYQAAELFFKDDLEPEAEDDEKPEDGEEMEDAGESDSGEVEVPVELLEAYAGKYLLRVAGMVLEYKVVDGGLIAQAEGQPEVNMEPETKSIFAYSGIDASVEFKVDENGEVTAATHSQGGGQFVLEPLGPYDPAPEQLKTYEGKYLSEELETFYTLEVRDSTLTVLIRNTERINLTPIEEDSFSGTVFFISELNFRRDKSGKVTGFIVSNDRTRGILFERL